MAPETNGDTDEKLALFNTMNGNGAEITSEAAGIVACLMAYSHHACRTECDAMTEHYYRLRDYALNHPECSAIMHLIDLGMPDMNTALSQVSSQPELFPLMVMAQYYSQLPATSGLTL